MLRCVPAALILGMILVSPGAGAQTESADRPVVRAKPRELEPAPKRAQPDKEVQTIIDMVATVPPEFGADILMRLVESGKVRGQALSIRLLRDAFDLAASAQQPISREPVGAVISDTRTGFLMNSFFLGLDRLSLQSRSISNMLPLDAPAGRKLFEQMQFPTLAPLTCEEPLAYDPSQFYRILEEVVRDGFTQQENLKGRQLILLEPYIALQSHSQVGPVAQLLASTNVSPLGLEELTTLFGNSLQQLRGDERSFAGATVRSDKYGIPGAFVVLIKKLNAQGLPSAVLLGEMREYFVANFGGVRCETAERGQKSALPVAVTHFNQQFQEELHKAQLAPIGEEEIRDARIVPRLADDSLWQSTEAKRLMADMRVLRFGGGEKQLTVSEKMTPKWSAELTDFLTELESWTGDDEPEVDFFHEKAVLYETLVDVIPSSPERSRVLDRFLEFLEQNYLKPTRTEWFWHARRLLTGNKAADDRPEVMRTFLNSHDPILGLYARVEDLQSRSIGLAHDK